MTGTTYISCKNWDIEDLMSPRGRRESGILRDMAPALSYGKNLLGEQASWLPISYRPGRYDDLYILACKARPIDPAEPYGPHYIPLYVLHPYWTKPGTPLQEAIAFYCPPPYGGCGRFGIEPLPYKGIGRIRCRQCGTSHDLHHVLPFKDQTWVDSRGMPAPKPLSFIERFPLGRHLN